jgi:AraC-like DNA-binding protein
VRSGSISEIGYAVGFQSLAHLSFRQHFGVSPSQFV